MSLSVATPARAGTLGLLVLAPVPILAATAPPPLVPLPVVEALAGELSGGRALETARELATHHRQRGSRGYAAAAEVVRRELAAAGLDEVEVLSFPADGETFYGTQRSRPGWDVEHAELRELRREGAGWVPGELVVSYADDPIGLAQDSASGDIEANLVDVGEATREEDYAGRAVAGRLVLTSSQPEAVRALAVDRFGAAGIVSWARNQKSAWWGDNPHQVRWGHLGTFPPPDTFAFMVSPARAEAWRRRLAAGEEVRLAARVAAGQHPSAYLVPTAIIRGGDPSLAHEEVAFSCHLDHPRPGANDNASGCAAILEVARAVSRLIDQGRLPRPRRTLRFYWPPEIEGTIALLAERPETAARTVAVVHMDMVGGRTEATGALFHVTRSPGSLPNVADDVAEAIARWVNAETDAFAATGEARWPLVDPAGSRDPLRAEVVPLSMGSDHQVWAEGSFRVPAIYLNDWPDRTIHTDRDVAENLDPTKLLRAAFVGAASAWVLADLGGADLPRLWEVIRRQSLGRTAAALGRAGELAGEAPREAAGLLRHHLEREAAILPAAARFGDVPPALAAEAAEWGRTLERLVAPDASRRAPTVATPVAPAIPDAGQVLRRTSEPRGPMSGFGHDWLEENRLRRGLPRPALLDAATRWGGGAELAYEALNLVDGTRSVAEIRDALAAIYGPLPAAPVADFLATLETLGVVAAENLCEGTSLLGEPLLRPALPLAFRTGQEEHLRRAERRLAADPDDLEAAIWRGRRTAYLGRYREAIAIFDAALARHGNEPRLLRHRGHRHLTLRQLDEAAADLERAAALVAGRPDEIEPDGLPNLADRPTSTLQTNIHYHLGLARALQGDHAAATAAWQRGLELSHEPDMWIATAYWLYLGLRRDGRAAEAAELLARVPQAMELLESHDYHRLLLVMRGDLAEEEVLPAARESGGVTAATVGYGLGAARLLAGDPIGAERLWREVVAGEAWAAFGHLAAEAELARLER